MKNSYDIYNSTAQQDAEDFFDLSDITDEIDLGTLNKGIQATTGSSTWNGTNRRGTTRWVFTPDGIWEEQPNKADSLSSIPQRTPVDVCDHAVARKYFHITETDWNNAYSEGAKNQLKQNAIKQWQRSVRQGPSCDFNGTFEVVWEEKPVFQTGVVGFLECKDCKKRLVESRRKP